MKWTGLDWTELLNGVWGLNVRRGLCEGRGGVRVVFVSFQGAEWGGFEDGDVVDFFSVVMLQTCSCGFTEVND